MATTKTSRTSTNNTKEVKDLKKQIEQLQQMVNLLSKTTTPTMSADRDITVISLCPNILNLNTGGYNSTDNTVYTFTEFGEEQLIPYSDVKLIIKNNSRFIKEGKCYIADEEVIKNSHLTKDYEKLLTKEGLINLLTQDRKTFETVFSTMTESQQETLKNIVSNRLIKDKFSVDMNIVQIINETLGVDLLKEVEFSKSLSEVEE